MSDSRREQSNLPQIDVTEDRDVGSLLELDPSTVDPDYHYRWVKEDALRMARHRMKGYTIVNKEEGVRTLAGELDDRADGTIAIGDTILMKCPKDRFKARRKKQRQFSEARLGAPQEQFKEKARKARPGGVRVIRDEE